MTSKLRRAFTLLEMLLVMALLVVVFALSYPTLRHSYLSVRVEAGADTARSAMARARIKSMDQGRPYRFAIVPGQGNFRVAPESPEYWNGSGTDAGTLENGEKPLILEDQAPENVRLYLVGESAPSGDYQQRSSADVASTEWRTVAVFFPDGTASQDVMLRIEHDRTAPMVLTLRSLTGAMSTRKATEDEMNNGGTP